MTHLLDTDHISVLQRPNDAGHARLAARMAAAPAGMLAFPVVSFHEQALGANSYVARARAIAEVVRGYRQFMDILDDFSAYPVLDFDHAAALRFEALRRQKVRIGTMDLRIAAIALSRGLTLLTRNAADFAKVPGLTILDWTV